MNYEKFLNQQLKWVRKHGTVESVEKHNWWIEQIEQLAKREAVEFPAPPAVAAPAEQPAHAQAA
jgi:hypothetical protein